MKKHLIIVPGHSIWKGTNKGENPEDWHLESFQREGNDHLIFIEHIKEGIKQFQDNREESVLVFSGGQTKITAGPKSEALSYFELAQKLELFGDSNIVDEVTLEEYARDSFENVLFSLCRFYQIFGRYPEVISIIGFEFKRHRFQNLHLDKALGWPMEKFNYIGIDPVPPYQVGSSAHQVYFDALSDSEYKFAIKLFEDDLLGNGPKLGSKKDSRNPFNRSHQYIDSNPQLASFFGESLNQSAIIPWK